MKILNLHFMGRVVRIIRHEVLCSNVINTAQVKQMVEFIRSPPVD